MISNKTVYWVAQCTGWLLYSFILLVYNSFFGEDTEAGVVIKSLVPIPLIGISVTHICRSLILRYNWLKLQLPKAVLIMMGLSVIMGTVFHLLHGLITQLLIPKLVFAERGGAFHLQLIMNWVFIIFFWSILYFATHYFINYKKEEIKNLKMEASQTETELINLKAQLNPHFMFNALNSIRALIDENPDMAKKAVTHLSSMLRAALQTGKRQLISLDEELNLINNYLAIEKIRFEERVSIDFDIDPASLNYNIPPLLLQTLVENAMKHGISSLTQGGKLIISTRLEGEKLRVLVFNSGSYNPGKKTDTTGIGLRNTERRLGLLYGKEASLTIENQDHVVETTVIIPKNLTYENFDS